MNRTALSDRRVGPLLIALAMLTTTFVAAPATPLGAATPDLLISEYIEGSSFNKSIEIYNGTGSSVDLSSYTLELYSNGSATVSQSVTLSGTLDDGDVYVVSHASSDAAILAVTDLESSAVANFNGDDAVVLQGASGVVDSFGQVGVDPGTQWPGGGLDDTLVRQATVCQGDTNTADAFDASVEWDVHGQNDFSFLGAHTADCDGDGNAPVVTVCDVPLVTNEGVAATASLSASDTDGTVVDISATANPIPAAGTIAIQNLVPAGGEGGTATADLAVDADVPIGTYSVTVTATNNDTEPQTDTCTQSVTVECDAICPISTVQGAEDTSPLAGQVVTIEGVVVGDYEGFSPALRGFYVQEEDEDQDGNPNTSEGIFVFHGNLDSVDLGDKVRVEGTVAEFQGQTQIGFPDSVEVISSDNTVSAAAASLPLASADDLERYEGMLVTFPQTLYVTEFFQLGRFGQVVVSSGDRLAQPTSVVEPGAPASALQDQNNLNRLIIDDELNNQNPDPIHFGRGGDELTAANTLRGGDTITGAVGVLTYTWAGNSASGNAYRLRVVGDLSDSGLVEGGVVPVFEAVNERPNAAPEVGNDVKVASFNVLNYFVTLDDGGLDCGPVGFPQECRGANTAFELDRQRAKLVEAILEIDADVLGIVEVENSEGVEAMADIVAALNAELGAGTYDYIDTGTIGSDVIKVGFIYQPAEATPVGDYAILDSSVDPRFDDDLSRPALAQTFTGSGETFNVVVNHLKSKGCGGATGANQDQGDGQACYNAARTSAAEALVDWVASDPTDSGDPDSLVIGDLNSYAMEDPIDVLVDAGYVDLARLFDGADTYSFVFDGQWGYLDYALGSPSIVAKVIGAAPYHINADEPSVLDYNVDFKSEAQLDSLFAPNEFRTSDHDPVLVGLALDAGLGDLAASPDQLWPPNHKYRTVEVTADGDVVTILGVVSSEVDFGLDPEDVPNDIVIVDGDMLQLRAERFSTNGRVYTIEAIISDAGQVVYDDTTVEVPHSRGRSSGR